MGHKYSSTHITYALIQIVRFLEDGKTSAWRKEHGAVRQEKLSFRLKIKREGDS